MRFNDALTHDRLVELLIYDPDTGEFRWRKSLRGPARAGNLAGTTTGMKRGRRKIKIDQVFYRSARLAFLYMTGEWPEGEVDHINRTPSDDRWVNLREATRRENVRNRGATALNKTGLKGVFWDKRRNAYIAQIVTESGNKRLGKFATAAEAHAAYREAANIYHGEFACHG